MNIWAIVAVFAALIFGFCVGYIAANWRESIYVRDVCRLCEETSEKLKKLSKEYEDFVEAAHEIDHWPKYNSHIDFKENLEEYLKAKYFNELDSDTDDDEEEDDEDMEDVYL